MIIYTHSFGRLGNQLWTHAHLAALAMDRGCPLLSTTLRSHGDWYDGSNSDSGSRIRIRPNVVLCKAVEIAYRTNLRLRRVPVIALADGELLDMDQSPELDAMLRRSPVVFASGLFLMASETLERHAGAVRSLLTPIVEVTRAVDARMAALRSRHESHVAVHLRRGDYRTFCDGDMYYTDAEYADAMRVIAAQFAGSTLFHLFSDEPLDPAHFAPLDVEVWSGNPAADLYAMGACDFIIGPNSSYSQWASFAGSSPLHVLNWRAEERHGAGTAIRKPCLDRDFHVFAPAGFGRYATRTVDLAAVTARGGRWE